MGSFKESELWKVFIEKTADYKKNDMVESAVNKAISALDLIVETFPTYTLHNHVHSENVLELIGQLLGDKINELSSLEAAILILSSFLHDIGMVYSDEDKTNIQESERFKKFLNENPNAYISICSKTEKTDNIIGWFYRWNHANRSKEYIRKISEDNLLKWGTSNLGDVLGNICESHNLYLDEIKDNNKFPQNFLYECDTKFCSILLRLADILDFDNTRSPEEVYKYLGLKNTIDNYKEFSNIEWRKHLCSDGFKFINEGEIRRIGFIASPSEPAVEYDVRCFLDLIESELIQCSTFLGYCSDIWGKFKLPLEIDRSNIISNGYKYGEYFFKIDKDEVLKLFLGENLYDSEYCFIRELLQNSIDTTRYRVMYEKSRGNTKFKPEAIVVTEWIDENGYQWVKVDDKGMGMDENIINNYFLKIGQSFYKSNEFNAEVVKYKNKYKKDFMPISRFGIGILSCFLIGDRIELLTKHINVIGEDKNTINLSMHGLSKFYVMKTEKMFGMGIQSEKGIQTNINGFGTSISIRIDPKKEKGRFDLKNILNKYIAYSSIPIEYKNEQINSNNSRYIDTPWTTYKKDGLSKKQLGLLEKGLDFSFGEKNKVFIEQIPIDITKYSSSENLKGQAYIFLINKDEIKRAFESLDMYEEKYYNIKILDDGGVTLEVSCYVDEEAILDDLSQIENDILKEKTSQYPSMDKITEYESNRENLNKIYIKNYHEEINLSNMLDDDLKEIIKMYHYKKVDTLSHNGIVLEKTNCFTFEEFVDNADNADDFKWGFIIGSIALTDSLRPDVNISRSGECKLTWEIISEVNLALQKAINDNKYVIDNVKFELFMQELYGQDIRLQKILGDENIGIDREWALQTIINTNKGKMSLNKLRKKLENGKEIQIYNLPYEWDEANFSEYCSAVLLQIGVEVSLKQEKGEFVYLAKSNSIDVIESGQELYPALFFVNYENTKYFRTYNNSINKNHILSIWLIENSITLYERYPGIYQHIKNTVSKRIYYARQSKSTSSETVNKIVKLVNDSLDRLSKLDKELIPNRNIFLKEEDFFMD